MLYPQKKEGFLLVFKSPFKFKCLAGVVLLFMACNIQRDNILDPKNEDSYQSQKLLIEAFVNTDNDFQYNDYMLAALDSLAMLYEDRVEVLEYHRNTLNDSSQFHQNISDIIYGQYVESIGGFKGVPHVFLNGVVENIQGASSIQSALFRMQAVIDPHLSDNSEYTIEVGFKRNGNLVTPEVKLARLGNQSASQLKVRAVLAAHIQNPYHKRVVVASVKSNEIPKISEGQVHELTLSSMTFNGVQSLKLIVYLTNLAETQVLQCTSIDVF